MEFQKMVIDENIDVLTKKNFFVQTGYEWGKGLERDKTNAFYAEVYEKIYPEFLKDGWEWKEPNSSGSCPTMEKHGREIYIHPMELTVTGDEKDFDKLRKIFDEKEFETFTPAGKVLYEGKRVYQGESNGYGIYFDVDEPQLAKIYEDNKPVIKYNIMTCIRNGITSHGEIQDKIRNVCTVEASHVYGLGFRAFTTCMEELEKDKLIEKTDGKYRICKKHKDMYFIKSRSFSSKEWKDFKATMDTVVTLKSKTNDDIIKVTMPNILKKREEDNFITKFIAENKKDLMILNHLKNTFESVPEKYPDMDKNLFNAPKLEENLKNKWKTYCVTNFKAMGYER